MADSPASGVELAQQSRDCHAIERVPTAIAAFIGRTLKGPVNQALSVRELRRVPAAFRRPVAAVDAFLRGGAVLRERRPRSAHRARGQRRAPAQHHAAGRRRRAAPGGTQSRLARIPARLGGLRRPDRRRARALQPRGAARAHRRLRAGRGPGDLPARVGAAGLGALRDRRAARVAPGAGAGGGAAAAPGPLRRRTRRGGGRLHPVQSRRRRRRPAHRLRHHRRRRQRQRPVRARRRGALQPAVHSAAGARARRRPVEHCWWPRACAANGTRC